MARPKTKVVYDLKRGPIERELRRYLKEEPRYGGRIVSCIGQRRDESRDRAKLQTWELNEEASKAGRRWHEWRPVLTWSRADAFARIAAAGQTPHWSYGHGMSRFSCIFCIFARRSDHAIAARLRPELYRTYCALEREVNRTLSPTGKFLPELIGIAPEGASAKARNAARNDDREGARQAP